MATIQVDLSLAGAPTAKLRAKFGERVLNYAVIGGHLMNDKASCCGDEAYLTMQSNGETITITAQANRTSNGYPGDYHSNIFTASILATSTAKQINYAARQLATLAIEEGCENRNRLAPQRKAEAERWAVGAASHNPYTGELMPCTCGGAGECYPCIWLAEYADTEQVSKG